VFVLIDNYDSFTFNLWQALAACGVEVAVFRNDAVAVADVVQMAPNGVVLSPGPRAPDEAGICIELVRAASGRIPLLGVCLGHQAIGAAFGAAVVRGPLPMHGRQSLVEPGADALFDGIEAPMAVGRYHSLVVDPATLPATLSPLAWTTESTGAQTLMAMRHIAHPTWGVQFHPESILTPKGPRLLRNFVELALARASAAAGGNEDH
jgi:anthranilate synthase component 2